MLWFLDLFSDQEILIILPFEFSTFFFSVRSKYESVRISKIQWKITNFQSIYQNTAFFLSGPILTEIQWIFTECQILSLIQIQSIKK